MRSLHCVSIAVKRDREEEEEEEEEKKRRRRNGWSDLL